MSTRSSFSPWAPTICPTSSSRGGGLALLGVDAGRRPGAGEVPHGHRHFLSRRSPTSAGWLQEARVVDAVAGQLADVAIRQRSASSSSLAPARIAVRRSDSSRANRQFRICPSAVSRVRSHAPQKLRVTDAMTPTVAGPPSTSQRSAGAEPRASVSGVRVCADDSCSRMSSAVTISPRVHAWWASSGICSMKRSS